MTPTRSGIRNNNRGMLKVVALALTPDQVTRYLAEAQSRSLQMVIVLPLEDLRPSANARHQELTMPAGKVRIRCYSDYMGDVDSKEFFQEPALHCLKSASEFLGLVQASGVAHYKRLPLLHFLHQNFATYQVWPFFQLIFQVEQVLNTEQPDEVWICGHPNWSYPILEPPLSPPFAEGLNHPAMELESMVRVARLQKIRLHYLAPSLADQGRYQFTRWLRPSVVRAYRQIQLLRSKLGSNHRAKATPRNGPLALALVRSPVHLARLLAPLQYLSDASWETCIVRDDSLMVAQNRAQSTTIPEIDFAAWQRPYLYLHSGVGWNLRRWLRRNQDKLPDFSYRGVYLTDIFSDILQQLADKCVEATSFVDAFSAILDTYAPAIVLVANDQEVQSRCLVELCARRNISTLTVQHGLMGMPPLNFVPVVTDMIGVMGVQSADLLTRFGTPPEKICISGVPGFDSKIPIADPDTLSPARASITLISQRWTPFFERIFPRFLQLATEMPGEQFVVKVSPQESPSRYRNLPPNVAVSEGLTLQEVLQMSKLVLGFSSTAVMEAMQMGVPTVVVDLFFAGLENPMTSVSTCIGLDSDWSSIIREILDSDQIRAEIRERQNKFLARVMLQDGGATQRLAELVQELASTSTGRRK